MKLRVCGVVAMPVALALAACSSFTGGGGGGGGARTPANRAAVLILMNAQGGNGCQVLASDNVAFRQDRFEWRVYSFCSSAAGQNVKIQFENGKSPAQAGTERLEAAVDSNPPGFARLGLTVDRNPNGDPCNGNASCFKYSIYLGSTKLLDPIFEVDP